MVEPQEIVRALNEGDFLLAEGGQTGVFVVLVEADVFDAGPHDFGVVAGF